MIRITKVQADTLREVLEESLADGDEVVFDQSRPRGDLVVTISETAATLATTVAVVAPDGAVR